MAAEKQVGIFGKTMREYVDAGELPWVSLAVVLTFMYVGSYWLSVSYLNLMAPLTLIVLVVVAIVVAYLRGVRGEFDFKQTLLLCGLIGMLGGVLSAILALVRFWYWWLAFNLLTEPVWSAVLCAFVAALTIFFFRLPIWVRQFHNSFTSPQNPQQP